jgi:hypothetical protein
MAGANILAELAVKITADTAELTKGLDGADKQMGSFTDSFAKHSKVIGASMVAVGAVITGALALAVKAAALEQAGIERLKVAMDNVGITYDGATGKLEKWIDAQQQSSAYADDEMRESLSSLIILTGNMTKAQEALTIAMDVARWKNIDLKTASDLLMKVYAGDMGMLKRYGIIVDQTATKEEVLAQIKKMAAGQAEAYAKTAQGQMDLLKNNIGDVSEAIGGALLENLSGLLKEANAVIQKIKEWISVNPELTTTLAISAAALSAFLVVAGTFIMIAPGILAAGEIMGAGFTAMLGPIGLVILAIAAVIAIGVALWQNWDKVVDFFTGSNREMTKVAKEELDKQLQDRQTANKKTLILASETNTKSISELKKHYGVLDGYARQENKTLMDLARDASAARSKSIELEMSEISRAHSEKMRMFDAEYNAKVKSLDASTDAATQALQNQIDAINDEAAAEARADEDVADAKRLSELQSAVTTAKTAADKMDAESNLADFQDELADKKKSRERSDRIDALNDQISTIREQAANQREALQSEHDAQIEQEDSLYNATSERLKKEKDDLDVALQAELIRLETERQAFEDAGNIKLAQLQENLAAQDTALQNFHDKEMARLYEREHASELQGFTNIGGNTWYKEEDANSSWMDNLMAWLNQPTAFATGGIVTSPQLAMVGEAGPEAIIPLDQMGGDITVHSHIYLDGKQITEVVSKELHRQQVLR